MSLVELQERDIKSARVRGRQKDNESAREREREREIKIHFVARERWRSRDRESARGRRSAGKKGRRGDFLSKRRESGLERWIKL